MAIDEATGKIAVCTTEEVHVYKPYGKKEGALKVEIKKRDSIPACEILTAITVVFSVLFTGSKLRRWHIDAIMGVARRAIDRLLFS